MVKEVGTLKELNVHIGDVVRHLESDKEYEIREREPGVLPNWSISECRWGVDVCKSTQIYSIVSRAQRPDTPKLWRDMTPEEKGALLLAAHEGEVIEKYDDETLGWRDVRPEWIDGVAYRVRSEPRRITCCRAWGSRPLEYGTCVVKPDGTPDWATWEAKA